MTYSITYSTLLNTKEVARLPRSDLVRIKKAIERKLKKRPDAFGKPLRFSLKGHRSLRVGEYRVIFSIENKMVKILIIAHRSAVYKEFEG